MFSALSPLKNLKSFFEKSTSKVSSFPKRYQTIKESLYNEQKNKNLFFFLDDAFDLVFFSVVSLLVTWFKGEGFNFSFSRTSNFTFAVNAASWKVGFRMVCCWFWWWTCRCRGRGFLWCEEKGFLLGLVTWLWFSVV